jgi:hypothetical protein
MRAEDVVIVAGAVTILTQMVKWGGLPDSKGPWIVCILSLIGVVMWAVSNEPAFDRHLIWPYFAGWVSVSAGSAGVFGFTRALPNAITSTSNPPSGAAQSPTGKM